MARSPHALMRAANFSHSSSMSAAAPLRDVPKSVARYSMALAASSQRNSTLRLYRSPWKSSASRNAACACRIHASSAAIHAGVVLSSSRNLAWRNDVSGLLSKRLPSISSSTSMPTVSGGGGGCAPTADGASRGISAVAPRSPTTSCSAWSCGKTRLSSSCVTNGASPAFCWMVA